MQTLDHFITELKLKNVDQEKKARFLVHLLQLPPDTQYKRKAFKKYITVLSEDNSRHFLQVVVSCL